jgi:hypothetical protein
MLELTPQQVAIVKRFQRSGFQIVAFPLYANYIGVRRENFGVLLSPAGPDRFQVCGQPSYLLEGNLAAHVMRNGKTWFVWKGLQVEATSAHLGDLAAFAQEVSDLLAANY